MRDPSWLRGTVVILSTIRQERSCKPFSSLGSIGTRNKGAFVGPVVNEHTVMDRVASNRSSCTITAGLGFPV